MQCSDVLVYLQIVCKTSPVHVAAAPRVPHDRPVVGKAGAMLQLPAGAAEVVEASQVSEYQQLLHKPITFKAMHLQKYGPWRKRQQEQRASSR